MDSLDRFASSPGADGDRRRKRVHLFPPSPPLSPLTTCHFSRPDRRRRRSRQWQPRSCPRPEVTANHPLDVGDPDRVSLERIPRRALLIAKGEPAERLQRDRSNELGVCRRHGGHRRDEHHSQHDRGEHPASGAGCGRELHRSCPFRGARPLDRRAAPPIGLSRDPGRRERRIKFS